MKLSNKGDRNFSVPRVTKKRVNSKHAVKSRIKVFVFSESETKLYSLRFFRIGNKTLYCLQPVWFSQQWSNKSPHELKIRTYDHSVHANVSHKYQEKVFMREAVQSWENFLKLLWRRCVSKLSPHGVARSSVMPLIQWFPNCGTRTSSGTRRHSRWHTNRPTFCFSSQNNIYSQLQFLPVVYC